MSKVIRVEDKIYDDLDQMRGRRDTFTQVIESLLAIRDQARLMAEHLRYTKVDPALPADRSREGQGSAPGERP